MGLASYYMRFVRGFSRISYSITSLQRKGVKFEWTYKFEEAFQCLKSLLTSALVLMFVDPNEDFLICVVASIDGLGGVLIQNGHVVCYQSRKWNKIEKNYDAHDLELAAIILVHKIWRHCLMDQRFELQMGHYGL